MNQQIIIQYIFQIILCFILGIGYAAIIYYRNKKRSWSKKINKLLFVIRTILVSSIAFLLFSPMIKETTSEIEKQVYVIGVDNSASIGMAKNNNELDNIIKELENIIKTLNNNDFKTEIITFDGANKPFMSKNFTHQKTDLKNLLNNISNKYEGRNLSEILLVSDGLHNVGSSPVFSSYNYKINTLLIGDTNPKKDVSIEYLEMNKLAFRGNQFIVKTQLLHYGYTGDTTTVSLSNKGKIIDSKVIILPKNNSLINVEFAVEAKKSGYYQYTATTSKKKWRSNIC